MENNTTALQGIVANEKVMLEHSKEQPILEIKDLSMAFNGLMALNGVSFSVYKGVITAIIGPNGAGKTTLSKLTIGLLKPLHGEIWFKQHKLGNLSPHAISSLGIAQVFQDIKLFANMSIIENVMVGCHVWTRASFLDTGLKRSRAKKEEKEIQDMAMSKLCLVGLEDKADAIPASLSWGQQRLVGLARALAANPELLFLDEPYGGLRSNEIEKLSQLVFSLQRQGLTILIVDHLMDCVMNVADRVVFLVDGRKVAEGTPSEIQQNEQVRYAYMGGSTT